MMTIKKSTQIIVNVILTIIACFTLIISIQTVSQGYSKVFGYSLFRVVTPSMEPTIRTGSLLICKEYDIENIQESDIICFRAQSGQIAGSIITHRVVKILNDDGIIKLETRGDNNSASDGSYVTAKNLIGKVVSYSRRSNVMSNVFSFVSSEVGFLAVIVFPVLLIAGVILKGSIISILNDIKKEYASYHKELKDNEPLPGYQYITVKDYNEIYESLKKEIIDEIVKKK